MTADPTILGLVLAGGRSSRMGGGDKPLLPLAGRTMLDRTLDRLAGQVKHLAISANGPPQLFERLGIPVLADATDERLGPLAGLLAGLDHARRLGTVKTMISVPADTPFLPADLVSRLSASAGPDAIAVAASASGEHPTVALWPVRLRDDLAAYLGEGHRRVRGFVDRHRSVRVPFEPVAVGPAMVDPFLNLNTPADLEAAEAMLAAAGEGAR